VWPSRKDASTSSPFANGRVDAAGRDPCRDVSGIKPNLVTHLVERDPSLRDQASDEPRSHVEHLRDLFDREERRSVHVLSV